MIQIRRALSGTPLTNMHRRALDGGRKRKAIPWASFDRSHYDERCLRLSQDQTQRLAEGEYGAVGLFGEIVSGLAMTGAPFDVVSAASTISSDEIRHADYCTQFAELCAGHALEFGVDRDAVDEACEKLDSAEEVDFFLLKYSAVGEALAAALLLECRDGASDPVARALYGSLLADEVHHARLGWYYFAWRAPAWSLAERQRLADRIAEFVVSLEERFWFGRDAPPGKESMGRALGVLHTERQRLTIAQVMADEIGPGLDAIGLGGSHAWAARRRGGQARSAAPGFVIGAGEADSPKPVLAAPVPGPRKEQAPPEDMAAEFLERAIDARGNVRFGLDPKSGAQEAVGLMHHGRAAIAIAALRAHGRDSPALERATRRLERDLSAALDGSRLRGFPEQPAMIAATLALALLSGVDCRSELSERARLGEVFRAQPWHAAQVATALGADAPDEVWQLCVRDLDHSPWAPWTARAAVLRGDRETYQRALEGLFDALTVLGPSGTTRELPAPAIARIAATLEALAGVELSGDQAGAQKTLLDHAREYLVRWQFDGSAVPGIQPELARGGFPLSPSELYLRSDVTGHALLALSPHASASGPTKKPSP
jgi:hypothetical protein